MEDITDDMLFAFAHGIRITLESLGRSLEDEAAVRLVLERMDAIVNDGGKHSLVRSNDDSITEWTEFYHLRALEKRLCSAYIREVVAQSSEEES